MYYCDKDMRPSKLKGTISLVNSTLLNDDDNEMSIRLELQNGKILHCEADTTKVANEWKVAFSESVEGLQKLQSNRHTSDFYQSRHNGILSYSSAIAPFELFCLFYY